MALQMWFRGMIGDSYEHLNTSCFTYLLSYVDAWGEIWENWEMGTKMARSKH